MREELNLPILKALGGLPVEVVITSQFDPTLSYSFFESWFVNGNAVSGFQSGSENTVIRVPFAVHDGTYYAYQFTPDLQELPEFVGLVVTLPDTANFNHFSPLDRFLTHPTDVPGMVHADDRILTVETSKLPEAVRFLKDRLGLKYEQEEIA